MRAQAPAHGSLLALSCRCTHCRGARRMCAQKKTHVAERMRPLIIALSISEYQLSSLLHDLH